MKYLIILLIAALALAPRALAADPIPCNDYLPAAAAPTSPPNIKSMLVWLDDDDIPTLRYTIKHKAFNNGITFTEWQKYGVDWEITDLDWDVSCGVDDAEMARYVDEYLNHSAMAANLLYTPRLDADMVRKMAEAAYLARPQRVYLASIWR